MKTHWIIIRTVCALFIIFGIGVWVGGQNTPAEPSFSLTEGDREELSLTSDASLRKMKKIFQRTMQKYGKELKLSDEQRTSLRPMFVRTTQRMALLERRSKARLLVLEELHEEMAPHLSTEQGAAADAILERARSAYASQ